MKKINYKALELKLRKIVEKRLEGGWNFEPFEYFEKRSVTGNFFSDGTNCCLLLAADPRCRDRNDGFKALGLDYWEDRDLEGGFEGWKDVPVTKRRLYELGARIRRDYCEFTND